MSQYGFKMQQLSPNARPSEALYNLDFKIIYTMKYRLDYLICFAFAWDESKINRLAFCSTAKYVNIKIISGAPENKLTLAFHAKSFQYIIKYVYMYGL